VALNGALERGYSQGMVDRELDERMRQVARKLVAPIIGSGS
jgi:hypothetical protein